MEKRLEGSLKRFEVPDILKFLKAAGCTGVLVLERPGQETKVFCRQGDPVFATSNLAGLGLAESVARSARKPVADLQTMLARGRRRGLPEGQILIEEGLVTDAELADHLRGLIHEALFDSFEWRDGDFAFFDNVEPPAATSSLPPDLHGLIMEGERRLDERARLAEVFPDRAAIVESRVIAAPDDEASTLAPDEWKVYRLADGHRSLEDICRSNEGVPEADTLAVLRRLLLAGYVALRRPAPDPSSDEDGPAASVSLAATRRLQAPRSKSPRKGASLPCLVVMRGSREMAYPIAKSELILGRNRNCDLVLADAKVSSSHARIECDDQEVVLVDLGSRNGSYVNGRRVTQAKLEPGDEIQLGMTRIVLRVDAEAGMS